MKLFGKLLTVGLAFSMALSLAACGGAGSGTGGGEETGKEPGQEEPGKEEEPQVADYLKDDGVLKILTIGNSFSDDAMEFLGYVSRNTGVPTELGNLYIGGCSLAMHYANATSGDPNYTFRTNEKRWSSRDGVSLEEGVRSAEWDFISFQQASADSGIPESYSDLSALVEKVKSWAPQAKLVWHATWAYQQTSTHPNFPNYGRDQQRMYDAIISTVQSVIVPFGFDAIVPNTTAIQNARTSFVGDNVTRDGYHLNDFGRFIAACTFFEALTGVPLSDFRPVGVTAAEQKVAYEAVANAIADPFHITQSKILTEE